MFSASGYFTCWVGVDGCWGAVAMRCVRGADAPPACVGRRDTAMPEETTLPLVVVVVEVERAPANKSRTSTSLKNMFFNKKSRLCFF